MGRACFGVPKTTASGISALFFDALCPGSVCSRSIVAPLRASANHSHRNGPGTTLVPALLSHGGPVVRSHIANTAFLDCSIWRPSRLGRDLEPTARSVGDGHQCVDALHELDALLGGLRVPSLQTAVRRCTAYARRSRQRVPCQRHSECRRPLFKFHMIELRGYRLLLATGVIHLVR